MSAEGPTDHCRTCTCDPTSAKAQEFLKRIQGIRLERASTLYCVVTSPEAHEEILKWWNEHRLAKGRRAKLTLELVAHQHDIEIVQRLAPPAPRSFRRAPG